MSVVELPSGLRGRVSGLKGKHAKLLADRDAMKSGAGMDQILAECWQETHDLGPYAGSFENGIDWKKILSGDRFALLMEIRKASFGDDFEFQVTCEECKERVNWSLKLSDLPVKRLSEEDAHAFLSGNKLEASVHGKSVVFKLPTGEDERRAVRQKKTSDPVISSILLSLVAIEGVEPHHALMEKFLEDADMSFLMDLHAEIERRNCGVETNIQIRCGECGHVQDVMIPFGKLFQASKKR